MIHKLLAISFGLALLDFNPPQAIASQEGARLAANKLFVLLAERGWNVRDFCSWGLLGRGESMIIRTTLVGGNHYKLVGAGCEDAYDVDLRLYDENRNFIDGDTDNSALAICDVTPRWTGTFYIKVTMADSRPDGAHFVLQYAYE